MFKRIFFDLILLGLVALAFGCSKSDDFQACDASSSIHLDDNICLSFEHGQLSQTQRQLIENLTISGIALITNLMPINDLHIRIVNNPNLVIPKLAWGDIIQRNTKSYFPSMKPFPVWTALCKSISFLNWHMKFIMRRGEDQSVMVVHYWKQLCRRD